MEKQVIWVEVKDNPNYEVSNMGDIRRTKNGRVLKKYLNERGYEVITLWSLSLKKAVTKKVNRIVWESFSDCDCAQVVDHIDDVKHNNELSNLRCITHSENVKRRGYFEKKNKYNLTPEIKGLIVKNYRDGVWSTTDIMKIYGIPTNYICTTLKRGSWNKFVNEPKTA